MPAPLLLLRPHASVRAGTGHVLRCLALAQAWREAGGRAVFVLTKGEATPAARLAREGCGVHFLDARPGSLKDAARTAGLALRLRARWIATDGYCFGAAYQRALRASGRRLLVIDDHGEAGEYCADLVLNQNLHARKELYARRAPHTRLFLGPRYALLRREFLRWKNWRRKTAARARRLLVTAGGSDPANATAAVLAALKRVRGVLEARVALGAANRHASSVRTEAAALPFAAKVLRRPRDMAELMAWAEAAIAAGGTTAWELAFMRLPALLLAIAPNQEATLRELEREGAAVSLGRFKDWPPDRFRERLEALLTDGRRRAVMGRRGRKLVDGLGASRLCRRMLALS
jgi:UDP-2,4-diacetamido-2,4,6-trideoxy-beta-L-altropyranose hydrolase